MELKTLDFKGSKYVTVAERLKYFRTTEEFKNWSIETKWLEINEEKAICQAIIKNSDGIIKSTGTAMEKKEEIRKIVKDGKEKEYASVNVTSHVENCETSAIGRALGNLGIGIDGGNVASYDEIQRASKRRLILSITEMIDETNRAEYEEQYKLNELPVLPIEELEVIEKQLLINEKKKVCKSIIEMVTPNEVKEILRKYKINILESLDLKELIFLHDMKAKSKSKVSKQEIEDLKECASTIEFDLENYLKENYKKKIEALTKQEYQVIKNKLIK
ncbi:MULTISPECIES: hypothetical protein [Fusobacterium]|jgi:hypothetical protein|uniref:hypothetical protein n=1 Tax=Fusobacterium TaxID=848 RepID=UPI000E9B33D9|nr:MULTISPECIES: hypothetical protein [Fusobacterium]HBJ80219.1 hypothetical protein [Fusobacterium sp.]